MLLVGSRALLQDGISLGREPRDSDWIVSWETFQTFTKCVYKPFIQSCYPLHGDKWVIKTKDNEIIECEIAWEGSTGESLIKLVEEHKLSNLDVAYTLKMSHRYLKDSPHFLKTMSDIKYLRSIGAKIPEELKEWFVKREAETYTYGHPSLNQNKMNFFDTKGVTYTYDHDSIHEAIKLMEKPAYAYFKPDTGEVWCSKEMFFGLTEDMKLSAVFEESCVLAIERSLVPFNAWDKQEGAFRKALEKVCTSITSGWFREYAWENYDEVVKMFNADKNYLKSKFDLGIQNKIIKLVGEV